MNRSNPSKGDRLMRNPLSLYPIHRNGTPPESELIQSFLCHAERQMILSQSFEMKLVYIFAVYASYSTTNTCIFFEYRKTT